MRKTAMHAFATTACTFAASCGIAASAEAWGWSPPAIATPIGTFSGSSNVPGGPLINGQVSYPIPYPGQTSSCLQQTYYPSANTAIGVSGSGIPYAATWVQPSSLIAIPNCT